MNEYIYEMIKDFEIDEYKRYMYNIKKRGHNLSERAYNYFYGEKSENTIEEGLSVG